MNIVFFNIWSFEKNLGKAYNWHMELLPNDDDWAIFTDGDVCFTTDDWGSQIKRVIELNSNAGIITCQTNRIGYRNQRYNHEFSHDSDIKNHAAIAKKLRVKYHHKTLPINCKIGGFFMAVKKSTWKEVKFDEKIGMLGVDSDFSERILKRGKSVLMMRGLYVFHYYRLLEGRKSKDHLLLQNGKLYNDNSRFKHLNK